MNPLIGAVICGLILVLIPSLLLLPYAYAWGWMRVRSVVVVGKGFDVNKAVEDQEELPEVCERPYVDLLDPLAVYPIDEEAPVIGLRPSRLFTPAPTLLPSKKSEPAVALVSKGSHLSLTDLIDDVSTQQVERAKKRVKARKEKAKNIKNNKLEILNR